MDDRTTAVRKFAWRRVTRLTTLLCLATLFAALSAAQSATAQANATAKKYEPASVRALPGFESASVRAMPGLQCELHPPGTPAANEIPLATDSDGYARFYAVRAGKGEAGQWLT